MEIKIDKTLRRPRYFEDLLKRLRKIQILMPKPLIQIRNDFRNGKIDKDRVIAGRSILEY